MSLKSLNPSPLRQSGVMLLEALIGILIFSLGILALMGMLGISLKTSGDAKYRADASYLTNQIIGSMWANRNNLTTPQTYAHNPSAGASVCAPTGAASANTDVINWLNDVQSALPGAPANLQQIVIGANNVVTVTICWQAPQETTPHNFVATAQING